MNFTFNVEGGDFTNAGIVSSTVKKMLKQIGAEVNIVAHARRGVITIDIDEEKIYIKLEDEGDGIPDINKAMQKGYSTASPKVREMGFGAGMGLPNIESNTDKLTINSTVGVGTTVEIINYF